VTVEEDAHADMDWIENNVVISVSKRRKEEDDKRKDTIKKMAAQEKARTERMAVDPHRKEVEGTYGDDLCSICVRPLVGWVQPLLCCNNFLHAKCVNKMMIGGGRVKKCPMCRKDIQPDLYKPTKAKSVAVAANIGEKVLLPAEEDFGAPLDSDVVDSSNTSQAHGNMAWKGGVRNKARKKRKTQGGNEHHEDTQTTEGSGEADSII
jgi:hypothetical protein